MQMPDPHNDIKRIAFVVASLTGEDLKSPSRDAALIYEILTDTKLGMCDAASSSLVYKCNNRAEFQSEFLKVLKKWNSNNQLILYFSGHGEVKKGKQYCILMGTEPIPFANIISDLQMEGVSRAILILDACRSGAALGGVKNNEFTLFEQKDIPQGIAIIASSKESQLSYELEDGSRSVFTHIFCEGIKTGLSGKTTPNDLICVGDIVDYIKKQLDTNSKYEAYIQRPVFDIDKSDNDIWIARNISTKDDIEARQIEPNNITSYDELRILYEQNTNGYHPCTVAKVDDLDLELIKQLSDAIIPNLYRGNNLEEVLEKLHLYSPILHNNKKHVHRSAVLCFHQQPQLIYGQARSIFVVGNPGDSYFRREDIHGGLSHQIHLLVQKVEKETNKISFIDNDGTRKEFQDIDLSVARELISNAIAHRDYDNYGTVKVTITKEALEIQSPGCFPKDISWNQLIDRDSSSVSAPVDTAISFYLTNLLKYEGIGRGFSIFRNYIEKNGADSLTCYETLNRVTIRLLRLELESSENSTSTYVASQIYVRSPQILNEIKLPFQALALPKDYVDRPEIRQKIKSKLIDRSPSRRGTLVVSAIYGLGGVGKSVMAAALAHDPDVKNVCKDGVLWITLGQNPDLLPCLYDWIQTLGDYDFKPTTIDSASSHLRSLLQDKQMLLVVDDAWNSDHVAPFQVGGVGCRMLVTTREAHVHDAERIDMDVMSQKEALELLLSKAQVKSLTVEEEQQARKLIEVLGGLPLAVDLAGAQIADGMSWNELLENLEAEIVYLETLDRPNFEGVGDEKTRKRLSLKASLNLSLKLLSSEQLQQFSWLGVLPEDVSIQPAMAATLWSISCNKARAVLRVFRAKALLLSGIQELGQESNYRIHDLMHDLARGLLTGKGEADIPGLDLHWPDAHGVILDRYCQQATNNLWHTLPDDHYIYSHLTWHMVQSGRLHDLHGLFQEVTIEGRNGWYERCEFLGQNTQFVIDLERAWKITEQMYEKNASQSMGLQIRYALIFSTLNSLAINIPANLMASLVKNKKWSPMQGLAYARQAQTSSQCSEIIQEIATFLPVILIPEALEVVRGIQDEYFRASALSRLVTHLPENLLSKALEIVRGIQNEYFRASALSRLVIHLPRNLLLEAFEVACGIQNEPNKVRALSGLVTLMPEVVEEILEIARGIQNEYSRAIALSELAAYLPEVVEESLELVKGIQNESDRARALNRLVTHLPNNLLLKALEIARGIQDEFDCARALGGLAAHLPEVLLEVLKVVGKIQNESDRARSLIEIAVHLPENLLSEAFDIARGIQSGYFRARAISELAIHLPENILLEALEVVREIQNGDDRAYALSGFAACMPEIVSDALNATRGIHDESDLARTLSRLAAYLPENLLLEALEIARGIQSMPYRARVLSGLAAYLPENLLLEALEIARKIQDESDLARAFSGLAIYLPQDDLSDVLDEFIGIQDNLSCVNMLSELSDHLPEDVLFDALEVARGIQSEYLRADFFSDSIPEIDLKFFNFSFCSEVLHTLSHRERKQFLLDIPKLVPAIIKLSNRSTLKLVVRAMREVCQQWP
jgi:predicted HTH transcriptional regulator